MLDPYKVLGVTATATDDEVKKAYYSLARKYHPDAYAGTDLADLANEKMKEINEAYSAIQKERAERARGANTRSTAGSTGTQDKDTDARLKRARQYILERNFSEAEKLLLSVPDAERNAEWSYLMGCVFKYRNFNFEAHKAFAQACYLDPDNAEYRAAEQHMRTQSAYNTESYRNSYGCSPCRFCLGMVCADCLCESFGLDLIKCC